MFDTTEDALLVGLLAAALIGLTAQAQMRSTARKLDAMNAVSPAQNYNREVAQR